MKDRGHAHAISATRAEYRGINSRSLGAQQLAPPIPQSPFDLPRASCLGRGHPFADPHDAREDRKFADSPVEGSGFEPSVPLANESIAWSVAEKQSDLVNRCSARRDPHRLDFLCRRVPASHRYALLRRDEFRVEQQPPGKREDDDEVQEHRQQPHDRGRGRGAGSDDDNASDHAVGEWTPAVIGEIVVERHQREPMPLAKAVVK